MSTSALLALQAIGRLERAGIPPQPRLTDPDHRLWSSFQRKLGPAAFVALLLEDAAQVFPVPFAMPELVADLDDPAAAQLVDQATLPPDADANNFLRVCARRLGRPDGGVLSNLPRFAAHERVLELPGTSGRAAAYLCAQHADLSFADNFCFVVDDPADRLLVGLAAVEARSSRPELLSSSQLTANVAQGRVFDRVIAHRDHAAGADVARALFPAERLLWV